MEMKVIGMLAGLLVSFLVDAADASITDVTARQRYPWNGKVDISYNVSGITAAAKQKGWITSLKVTAKDNDTDTTYIATSLTGDASLADGTHAIIWDMSAQGLTFKSTNVMFNVTCETKDALYCVVDLSGGSTATSYPVTYMSEIPGGSWSDEYKTTKLVLRRIEAGSFIMGEDQKDESHRVKFTKSFYMGIFEVTQKQWSLVMGSNPSSGYGVGDAYPVYFVSYDMIRGSASGAQWPESSAVDATTFVGKLQIRSGVRLDLPTEAQWEYVCRAGTTTIYYWGDTMDENHVWYSGNSDSSSHAVGTKLSNAWGFYDMRGNLYEWCLDWYGTLSYGTDPMGPSAGSYRVRRGGCWNDVADRFTSAYRYYYSPSRGNATSGFRLRLTIE